VRRLSLEWFKDIPTERKEEFERALRSSTTIVSQLLHLLDTWELDLNAQETIVDYDTPSWAAKQAHRNGDRARIRKLRDLLSFLKEK
jgi:hypothetical protein